MTIGMLLSLLRQTHRRAFRDTYSVLAVAFVLAPAVGLNAAALNLVATLMFWHPAHVADPSRLVEVSGVEDRDGLTRLSNWARTVDVGGYYQAKMTLGSPPESQTIRVQCVTPNYLLLLGARPHVGRFIEERDGARAQLAVLGYGFWHTRFAAQPSALGTHLRLRDRSYTVVGVAPPGFSGVDAQLVDVFIPLDDVCATVPGFASLQVHVIGRIRTGFSQADTAAEFATFLPSTPDAQRRLRIETLRTARRGVLRRDEDLLLWLGFGALIVLVTACLNASALFSIVALRRRREIAIRHALGAGRRQIAALLTLEGLCTALLCCLGGSFAAHLCSALLFNYYPVRTTAVTFHAEAVLMTLLATLAIGACALSSAIPAFYGSRLEPVAVLKADSPGFTSGGRPRNCVLVVQVAFAFALLVVAALFERSLVNVQSAVGFEPEHVVLVTIDPYRAAGDDDSAIQDARDAVLRELKRFPWVADAALASFAPLDEAVRSYVMVQAPGAGAHLAALNVVSPAYCRTLGTRVLRGREFSPEDTRGGAPVAMASEELALRVWHSTNIIGECLKIQRSADCTRIVGVTQSMRSRTILSPSPELFVPVAQQSVYRLRFPGRTLLVRLNSGTRRAGDVSAAVRAAAPNVASEVVTLSALSDPYTRSWRLGATVFGLVGVLTFALGLAGVGVSLALVIRERTPEIGIRVALGATRTRVFATVWLDGMRLVTAGWLVGAILAVALTHLVRRMLFGLSSVDVATFLAASVGLFLLGAVACGVPSLRAARLDALAAIRKT